MSCNGLTNIEYSKLVGKIFVSMATVNIPRTLVVRETDQRLLDVACPPVQPLAYSGLDSSPLPKAIVFLAQDTLFLKPQNSSRKPTESDKPRRIRPCSRTSKDLREFRVSVVRACLLPWSSKIQPLQWQLRSF